MPLPVAFDGFIEISKRVSPTCLISFERNRYEPFRATGLRGATGATVPAHPLRTGLSAFGSIPIGWSSC